MSRSRSSFDLSGAIATATSLTAIVPEEPPAARYRRMPLVSFAPEDPAKRAGDERAPSAAPPELPAPPSPTPEEAPSRAHSEPPPAHAEAEAGAAETARRPPKLPDLTGILSPLLRCQKIIEWIVEAVDATDVFIADAAGLPIAGAVADAEARLGATGVVASAVAHLASALPGSSSPLFEMHLGDGPFFQLIGFEVGAQSYVVGFHRPTPLGFRQAHAVRLACRHALTSGTNGAIGSDHDGVTAAGRAGAELAAAPPSGEADPVTRRRAAEAAAALAKGAT